VAIIDFKPSDNVALDTNIFIYALSSSGGKAEKSRIVLNKIKELNLSVSISVLAFEEFLVKVYKENLEKDLSYYEDFLTGGGLIRVMDLDRSIARRAAFLRSKYKNLRAPDAIHLASAIEARARIFVTADRRLPKKIDKLAVKVLV
jgi:predicted nucleic acid-binding protein